MKKFTLVIIVWFLTASISLGQGQPSPPETKKEAERLWELAIQAKGGRNKLAKVESILISSVGKFSTILGARKTLRRESLYVLPGKSWDFEDYGSSSPLGASIKMFNYEHKTMYFQGRGGSDLGVTPLSEKIIAAQYGGRNVEISLLLESKWLIPVPVTASQGKIGSAIVDIVETSVNGQRVDFFLDRTTHLPLQVNFYRVPPDKGLMVSHHFADYRDLGGIKVPQRVRYASGNAPSGRNFDKTVIQFNVDYDPDIFVKPTSRFGPEAWRLLR